MVSCHSRNSHLMFTRKEIEESLKSKGLLSMEIEFSLRCNFRCLYCYANGCSLFENELSREEICDTILQAKGSISLSPQPVV